MPIILMGILVKLATFKVVLRILHMTALDNIAICSRRWNLCILLMKTSWFINATLMLINPASISNVLKAIIPFFQKLLELNNLHSLMSVVSALQSAPIFRLTKTWAVSVALTIVPSVLFEFWVSLEFVIL